MRWARQSHNVFVFIAAIQYSNGDWRKMTERGHKLNASIKTLQNFTKEQLKIVQPGSRMDCSHMTCVVLLGPSLAPRNILKV